MDLLSRCGNTGEEEDWGRITEPDVRQAQQLADMVFVYHPVGTKAVPRASKTREQSGSVMHGLVSSASVAWLG
jgi:hypothetical protein